MTLSPGSRLGPYEILAPLGAGGMGEVFRARDSRLGRDVAIKLVHPRFAADADQLRRFEQEARAASRLDHPNILVVHDVGSHEGCPYLVSELLEGETLREKLGAPLQPRRAIEYAVQVANGLAAAHEKGIVHRDLKPENLFVTRDGRIKILDFGLAKLTQPAIPSVSHTEASTAVPATEPGVVMGTVGYMSPEQVLGRSLDARTDLFSLGVVLYEMLSGKRPFHKESAPETMAAILKDEPAVLSEANSAVPPGLERIVLHCLEKEPSSRFQSARDVAFALETLSVTSVVSGVTEARAGAAVRVRRRVPVWVLVAAASLAVVLGLVFGALFPRHGSPAAKPLSLTLSFPADAEPDIFNTNPFALSPDGRTLVYAGLRGSQRGGQRKLFVRSLDRDEIREIPDTEGASHPFFSPDGLWVGFFGEGKLKKVALAGGSPITLCNAPRNRGASWGPDGTIVFVPAFRSGLLRIPAAGGEPKAVTTLPDPANADGHVYPQILPDGESVLFEMRYFDRANRAAVVSLRTGERRVVLENAVCPRYLPTGHLVFAREGLLHAAPFNLKRLRTTGPPVPLLQDMFTERVGSGDGPFALSQEGTLVYVPYRLAHRTLVWVDRKGALEQTPFPIAEYRFVALSPDGGRVAVITGEKAEAESLLIGDLARGTLTPSTVKGTFQVLAWTPDGKRIAFSYVPEGKHLGQIFWLGADGSTAAERVGPETVNQANFPTAFSPDGSALLIQAVNFTFDTDLHHEMLVFPLTGEGKVRPFFQSKSDVTRARFSPDGRWVAYESNESARWETYVQPYPGPGPRWQISVDGGRDPRWSGNGRELFYRQGSRMMAVDVETQQAFRAGRPRTLFDEQHFVGPGSSNSYDVAPDGTRFLMIKADPAESSPTPVKVVLNWFEEVERRVPAAK